MTIADGVTFSKIPSLSNWAGIDINSGGSIVLSGDATIEYATNGVRVESSSTPINNGSNLLTIKNCDPWGMYVYNVSPTINNVLLDNNETASGVSGGIKVSGSSANPTLNHFMIDNGDYGMNVYNTTAEMINSDIYPSNEDDSIRLDLSSADVELDDSGSPGNNKIMPDTGNSKKAVYRYSNTAAISAVGNWWGDYPVDDSELFYPTTGVTTTSAHEDSSFTSGVYKPAIFSRNLLADAREFEKTGAYDEAYALYEKLFEKESNAANKKKRLKSLIKIKEITKGNTFELEQLIEAEKVIATGEYAAILDYFMCDLAAKTGKYSESVLMFEEKLDRYTNTPMELEMLCRLATIYGDNLNNKEKALEYADRAASISAGYGLLDVAYDACDITYNPGEFVDTTSSLKYSDKPEPETEEVAAQKPTISVSPNPANPISTISYNITESSNVKLTIYSVSGQKVETLVDGFMPAGKHAATFDGANLASGVYFYQFAADGFAKTGKMVLVK